MSTPLVLKTNKINEMTNCGKTITRLILGGRYSNNYTYWVEVCWDDIMLCSSKQFDILCVLSSLHGDAVNAWGGGDHSQVIIQGIGPHV